MQIKISHYTFTISAPYGEGSVLSAAEAQALNALRAENIRNSCAKAVKDVIGTLAEGQLIDPTRLAALQQKITDYDVGYEFVLKHSPKAKPDPVQVEARKLAEAKVAELGFSQGEERDNRVKVLTMEPHIQALARERVGRVLSHANTALEELL